MTISIELVTDFVYEHCENVKTSKGGTHFLARCPICGDSKKSKSKRRFNLDYNNGSPIYNCFNCGASGSFISLYSTLKGVSISDAIKELRSFNPDLLKQKLSKPKPNQTEDSNDYSEDHNYILKDSISPKESVDGYLKSLYQKKLNKYIEERHIDSDMLIAYRGRYQGRYIIPIYDENNRIVYFQARRLEESMIPKYMNPPIVKTNIIYNRQNINKSDSIIVCEGLLDAKSVYQGTSCLGKEINNDFLLSLMDLTTKDIIVAFDNDSAGMTSTISLISDKKIPNRVKFFLFPYKYKMYKDLNQFAVSENLNKRQVYDFVQNNSYTKVSTYTKIKTVKWRNILLEKEKRRK
jgi:DNA primase